MMREIGADAVCLNELDSCAVRTRGVFQLERVAGLMGGWDFCYGPAMPFQGGAYGEGVMTREPAVRKFFVPLPQAGGRFRNDWAIHTASTVFFCPNDCPPAAASP